MRWFRNVWANSKQRVDLSVLEGADVGAPVNGTSGTGAGIAGIGSSYIDTATGNVYYNVGTKLSPIWTSTAAIPAANLGGLGAPALAKMTYSFATDGGVQGLITPANSPTLPAKAIILGGVIDITTTLTSGGSATIALGTSAGSSATSLKAATAVATWAAGVTVPVVPVFTAASYVKLTAAGRLTLTVATADLTAGVFDVQVLYVIGN